ncbi:hypothetical protein Taro_010775 [Colocasia esculenta]|uniref:Uncharacterized protein n=1 Tax=Colocasia esculenta TaxID=4460 RepID=A0A843U3Z7_COLES|nr:hypothetical protein [Colocasia esculenta]
MDAQSDRRLCSVLCSPTAVNQVRVEADPGSRVFSAFGFVHKIATFEKTAGFQALIQFSDIETATSAKNSLDGRSIPRYLLQENVGPCTLRIAYSAHTDLNVKFQSHRSRDYTNPYLPVAPSAIDGSAQVNIYGEAMPWPSKTVCCLLQVFSAFGPIQKIAIFEKNAGFQALIQYPGGLQPTTLIRTANCSPQEIKLGCCVARSSSSWNHRLVF